MKDYLIIQIKTSNKSKILLKLNQIDVSISNISYTKDSLIFTISRNDLKRVKKYLFNVDFQVIDTKGLNKFKHIIHQNMLFIISLIFALSMFVILSHVIVKVNIIHESKEIRDMLQEDLASYGVKPLSFKKSYQEYEDIITKIKDKHKDKIEWLEIDVQGMVINIKIEERIINDYTKNSNYCHIYANKSGIITKILTQKGVSLVNPNDYVAKGDILISGEIKLNDEIKNDVCASGKVYAEVWYDVKTSFPLKYLKEEKTGKMRYNFMVKHDNTTTTILKSRLKDKTITSKLLFKIFNWEFYLNKEYEVTRTYQTYTVDEALNKAKEKIYEKFQLTNEEFKIINEKVLQKNVKNDTLDIDMFLSIEEQIGISKNYNKKVSEDNDIKNNGNNNPLN